VLIIKAGIPKGLINIISGYGTLPPVKDYKTANIRKSYLLVHRMTGKNGIARIRSRKSIPCVLETGW